MSNPYSFPPSYKNVVTIIAKPDVMPFTETEMSSVVDLLQANGAIIEDVRWLAEGEACDIFFAVLPIEEVQELLAHLLANVPFDFVVQEGANRKKKMLISDMDSTIIQQECIDELADFVGLKEEISAITERAMNGELDFPSSLRERVSKLKGLAEDKLIAAFEEKITFMPGAKALVQTMKSNGARCVLVSGGFTFFASRVADVVGFDVHEANILDIENGILTGMVKEPILDSEAKLNSLNFHAGDLNIGASSVIAVGDGANDLPMIMAAGLGVAYHAKPHVRSQAKAQINACDLQALLYMQGYSKDEIITGS